MKLRSPRTVQIILPRVPIITANSTPIHPRAASDLAGALRLPHVPFVPVVGRFTLAAVSHKRVLPRHLASCLRSAGHSMQKNTN